MQFLLLCDVILRQNDSHLKAHDRRQEVQRTDVHEREQSGLDEDSQFADVACSADVVVVDRACLHQDRVLLDDPRVDDLDEDGHIHNDADDVEDRVGAERVDGVEDDALQGQAAAHDSSQHEEVVQKGFVGFAFGFAGLGKVGEERDAEPQHCDGDEGQEVGGDHGQVGVEHGVCVGHNVAVVPHFLAELRIQPRQVGCHEPVAVVDVLSVGGVQC